MVKQKQCSFGSIDKSEVRQTLWDRK